MSGCLKSLGCLTLLVIIIAVAWLARATWMPLVERHHGALPVPGSTTPASPVAWEPLTVDGAARARDAIQKLDSREGPVFADLRPGDLTAYIFDELSKQLPPSAEDIEAAVIDDQLDVRANVKLSDFGNPKALGPLSGVLGDRAPVEFGGTLAIVRHGLGQYRVTTLRIGDLPIPKPIIPKLLAAINHRPRPVGVADNGLPLTVPPYIADVRIRNGKITLYKAVR